MKPTISIIVPVYNTSKYLYACVESILNQSFVDFELLLIDDGSTDNSGAICDEFAIKDSRVKVIHKKNGGVSHARNAGLDIMSGDWVYFVDSDDTITPDCLELLYKGIDPSVDVVEGQYARITDKGSNPKVFDGDTEYIPKSDYLVMLFEHVPARYRCYPVTKIYRASVIRNGNLRFDTNIFYKEDGLFITSFICKMDNGVKYIHRHIYNYLIRNDSMVRIYNTTISEKTITQLDGLIGMYKLATEVNHSQHLKDVAYDEMTRVFIDLYKKMLKSRNLAYKSTIDNKFFKFVSYSYLIKYIFRKLWTKF